MEHVNIYNETSRLYDQLKAIPLWKASSAILDEFRNKYEKMMRLSQPKLEANIQTLANANRINREKRKIDN